MTFNSIQYFAFLILVVGVVWMLKHRQQNVLLLVASYVFYATWDWRFLGLVMLSTLIGYSSGLALDQTEDDKKRKAIVFGRVAMNLALLGVFKYANFFIGSTYGLLDDFGVDVQRPTLRIILPIAISYFTFEEISYVMDVYRRQIKPVRSVVDYALFVAFFPKLVAGPILRPRELFPQIERVRRRPDAATVQGAAALITLGLFKKVVIADALAPRVNSIFDSPQSYNGTTLLFGVYAFALQIYGDFSGYSDIARGSARLLGFDLPLNFREPYLSPSITQFWRDWHISLSSWLRDYLYVPLGGNRRGPRRTMINLFLVMLLGGLWHGAAWTFVAWGALHGLYLAFERITKQDLLHDGVPRWRDAARILWTFHLTCFAWIFFRAKSFDDAWRYIAGLARPFKGQTLLVELVHVPLFLLVMFVLDLGLRANAQRLWRTSPAFARGAVLGSFWIALFVFSGSAPVPFIYFQF